MPKRISAALSGTPTGEPRPPAPWHDDLPKNKFWCLCYKALCMIAVSTSSAEHWRYLTERPIKKEWIAHKEMVMNRFENMNVTAGLVLTTSAVFISTDPPFAPLMPYASGSYILQVCAFVAALISLMTGTSVLIIYDTCYTNDQLMKTLMHSRWRRICCLILMAYPSLALAVSTLTLMTAFFIAGFTSDKLFVKIMTAGTYLTLILLGVLAICVFSPHLREIVDGESESHATDSHNPQSSEPKVVRDSGVCPSDHRKPDPSRSLA
ncbi:uncharacterized protein BJ212DRAFT_1322462 [Suillus subaureus]|uniref:Uncharacterized protein n=1 Tax=Suillus subaureus TaxID=48587 RepID=A0A9P7JIF3_9AGAM|nr:uncharacterized protein BJ212DRAFT_1322462 [Suillus subaureus]KAG1824799.1 hypothetical protein BJ212DRAFT_1322462 [Suillus subaureus]